MDDGAIRSRLQAEQRRQAALREQLRSAPWVLDLVGYEELSPLVGGLMDASEVVTESDLAAAIARIEERQKDVLRRLAALESLPPVAPLLKPKGTL